MGQYLVPLAQATGNIAISADGSVWAQYMLTGFNVSPAKPDTLTAGQRENDALFTALSHAPVHEAVLIGMKALVPAEELATKMVQGLEGFGPDEYPDLATTIETFYRSYTTGGKRSYRRRYLLSVQLPGGASTEGRQKLTRAGAYDAVEEVNMAVAREAEEQVFKQLPESFYPRRATPDHLNWAHERMRLRGLSVPVEPVETNASPTTFNTAAFTPVLVHKAAAADTTLTQFMAATAAKSPPKVRRRRWRQAMARYPSVRWAQALSVHSPEERTTEQPDGPGAVQSMVAIQAYPTQTKHVLNTFTYLVDQEIGVDADFVLRMSFSQDLISTEAARDFGASLRSENSANSTDEFDVEQYADRATEAADQRAAIRNDDGPRGVAVVAIFAFADPNPLRLATAVSAIQLHLRNEGFRPTLPVGGQFDLLCQMLPAVPTSELADDLKQVTTATRLAACLPVRRTEVGDQVGVPIAVNKENALGQVIFHDLLSTSSGSMIWTGVMGSGKTYVVKGMLALMNDMKANSAVLDPSDNGEYAVFAGGLGDSQTVRLRHDVTVSVDPLKVFADRPEVASEVFIEIMVPLLDLDPNGELARLLSNIASPDSLRARHLTSSRRLIGVLQDGTFGDNPHARELQNRLQGWAGQTFTHALFDRIGADGRAVELPAYTRRSKTVVWRTNDLTVPEGPLRTDTSAKQRYAAVMHNLVALIVAKEFTMIRGICGLLGDEMQFMEGTEPLRDLVYRRVRTGRKEAQFVIAIMQSAEDAADPAYSMISKRAALRQDIKKQAAASLTFVDMPALPSLVTRMTEQTSPPNPARPGRAIPGREGEGWYNDGYNISRIQTMAVFTEKRRQLADTDPENVIRERDLPTPADPDDPEVAV